jgi:osmotically-inducible protein OsmY
MENTGTFMRPLMASVCLIVVAVSCRPRDPEIAESVRSKVSALAQGISVEVREGIVTLTGEVADSALRASIEGASKGVLGVRSIVNAIRVSPAWPGPLSGESLRERIRASLEARGIRDVKVEVDSALVATLSGWVELSEDTLAVFVAREAGASRVIDNMKVVK